MSDVKLTEGTVFAVPLENGGFAVGVIARKAPRRGKVWIVYCYFFGPFRCHPELSGILAGITKQNAKIILKCGALKLQNGAWPVLGLIRPWRRDEWPLLDFVRYDESHKKYYVVKYDDEDVSKAVQQWPTEVPDGLVENILYGADAAATLLSRVMKSHLN